MLFSTILAFGLAANAPLPKVPFDFKGMYVEGCTCTTACTFELTGKNPGCSGVAFFVLQAGEYGGRDLAGTKVALASGSDGWLRLYVDARDDAHFKAASMFAKAAFKDFGKLESVSRQPISVTGLGGGYDAKVAGGQILELRTIPVLTGPKRQPVTYSKIFNSTLHPEIIQAKTLLCSFKDGGHNLDFKNSNAFYHPRIRVKDRL